MGWYPNPRRIHEIFDAEKVKAAADALLAFKRKEVLHVLAWAWGIVLGMVFTGIVIVRFALSLPVWR